MSDKVAQPTEPLVVLILGGITTVARTLTRYLLVESEKRSSFIRIADRFSVKPPSTYLENTFLDLLNSPTSPVEYKQVNLSNVERHTEIFTPPSTWNGQTLTSKRFDVVYDLTGDPSFDKSELIQISHTYQLAIAVAQSAAALPDELRPRAYVRLTFPFYEMKSLPSSSPGHPETAELRPDGVRGRWWHEVVRGLATLDKLNTGVIRCGAWYGPGSYEGEVTPRVVIGHIYKYLNDEKMKFLHNADLRINTVHSDDIAQALYLLSLYLLATPRATVLAQTAVDVPFSFTPPQSSAFSLGASKRSSMSETWKTVKSVVPDKQKVSIPLLNIVDENDSTQDKLAKAVAEVWGIEYGFLNSTMSSLVQQFAKTDFAEMVEDVNETHVEAWSEMLSKSDPPIGSSPITPFLGEHAFRKLAICLDGSKAKRVLGYKATVPTVQVAELKKIVKEFQDAGLWPKLS